MSAFTWIDRDVEGSWTKTSMTEDRRFQIIYGNTMDKWSLFDNTVPERNGLVKRFDSREEAKEYVDQTYGIEMAEGAEENTPIIRF